MLLTVGGLRTSRELAELVKALLDACLDGGFRELDPAFELVERRRNIVVPEDQRRQVYEEIAAELGPEVPDDEDPAAAVPEWLAEHRMREPDALGRLLQAAWTELHARAEAELLRETEERKRGPRPDPIVETIRALPLTGRYFVVAHNSKGKPSLSDVVIGLGLAAAIAAELVLAGLASLEIRSHLLTPAPAPDADEPPEAPEDSSTGALLSRTAAAAGEALGEAEPAPIRRWLADQAATAGVRVRTELADAAVVHAVTRGMVRERVYHAPANRGLAPAVRDVVVGSLGGDGPVDPVNAVLAELAIATGLDAAQGSAWSRLASMTRGDALARSRPDPAGPPDRTAQLKLLVDLTAAEVDAVVTSPGL